MARAARDIEFYDLGYQSTHFDLVVLAIKDLDATVETLFDISPTATDFSYESRTVWRIPRPMTQKEIRTRLSELPCVFPDVLLYFRFERLREAERSGHFKFHALGRPKQ